MPRRRRPRYHISCPARELRKLRRWLEAALALGIDVEVKSAIDTIYRKLASDPRSWGDPNYRLRELKLTMYHGLCEMFEVYFGVHDSRKVVFIKEFNVLPGYGLETDN